jgi:hypothetical protein
VSSSAAAGWARRVARATWVAAGLATLAEAPALAQGPAELSRAPIPEDADGHLVHARVSAAHATGAAVVAPGTGITLGHWTR